jgi:hypothetical protein
MTYIVRKGMQNPAHFVVLDRWPGPTVLAGVFSSEAQAIAKAPILEAVDAKLAAMRAAREAAEAEKAGAAGRTLVKRKP